MVREVQWWEHTRQGSTFVQDFMFLLVLSAIFMKPSQLRPNDYWRSSSALLSVVRILDFS